jgi:ribose/xylose/arabinose/galactoside ABC-type transport system permease subunit
LLCCHRGVDLYGGQGGVIGSLFCAGVLSVLKNVLNLHNVQDFAQRVFTGILILSFSYTLDYL